MSVVSKVQGRTVARRVVWVLALVLLAIIRTATENPSYADETSEQIQGVLVEQAVMKPAKAGCKSQLTFKITNFTANSIKLLAVRAHAPKSVRISMNMHDGGFEHVSGLSIMPEETLDLTSSHIRVELTNLTRGMEIGSKMEFELQFERFSTTAVADVH